jgi:hypothetical protein
MYVQNNSRIVTSEIAYAEVARMQDVAYGCIAGGIARTIASWWQSPGRIGHVLASFASGAAVDALELLRDVEATIAEKRASGTAWDNDLDEEALTELTIWVDYQRNGL